MNDYHFEEILNKNVSYVEGLLNCKFENNLLDEKFYYGEINDVNLFHGYRYNFVGLYTNENGEVISISISLKEIADLDFIKSLIGFHGIPNSIKKVKSKRLIGVSEANESDTFKQTLKQYELEMEECAINDQPIYLVWIREKYTIRLSMRYERGYTEVMFNENYVPFCDVCCVERLI